MKIKIIISVFLVFINISAANGQPNNNKPTAKETSPQKWDEDAEVFKFSDTLPKNYNGTSAEGLIKWVLKMIPQEKGEFEKQTDFEKRIAKAEDAIINKTYAFIAKYEMGFGKYDADKEAFLPQPYHDVSYIGTDQAEFMVNKNHIKLGKYIGSDEYGKIITVKKFSENEFGLLVSKSDLMKTGLFEDNDYRLKFKLALNVPIEKAKKIKASDISALIIGQVGVRSVKKGVICIKPDDYDQSEGCLSKYYLPLILNKIYIYHKPTGEVLAAKNVE